MEEPDTPIGLQGPVTLVSIANFLDERLSPMTGKLKHLETEVSGLNKTVFENKQDADNKIHQLREQLDQMKHDIAGTGSATRSMT